MTALLFPPFDRSRPAPRPPDGEPATESGSRLHPVAGIIEAAVLATVAATNPLASARDAARDLVIEQVGTVEADRLIEAARFHAEQARAIGLAS